MTPGGKGKTRWYRAETSSFSTSNMKGPSFKASIPTSNYEEGCEIAVFAVVEAIPPQGLEDYGVRRSLACVQTFPKTPLCQIRPNFEFWMLLAINTLYLLIHKKYIESILYRLYIGPPELYCRRGSVCPCY